MPGALRRRALDLLVPLLAGATVIAFACGSSSVSEVARVGHGLRWAALGALFAGALLWGLPRPRTPWQSLAAAAALCGLAALSTAWSVEPRVTFEHAVSLGFLLGTCVLLAAASARPGRAEALLAGLLAGAVVVGLLGLVLLGVAHGDAVQAATYATPARFRGLGEDPNTVALLDAVAVPLAVWAVLVAGTPLRRLAAGGAIALLVGTIVATGSRGALVAGALGAAVVLLAHERRRRRALAGALAIVVAVVAGAAVQSLPDPAAVAAPPPAQTGSSPSPRQGYVDAEAAYPLEADIGRPLPGGGEPPVRRRLFAASGRVDAWRGALHEAARRPIAGHGFGAEREVFVDRYYRFVGGLPENSYVGLALQLGAAGLLAFAALVAILARAAFRSLRGPGGPGSAAALGVIVAGLAIAVSQSYVYSVGNIATATFWIAAFLGRRPGDV